VKPREEERGSLRVGEDERHGPAGERASTEKLETAKMRRETS
jgi:hypothetical protein